MKNKNIIPLILNILICFAHGPGIAQNLNHKELPPVSNNFAATSISEEMNFINTIIEDFQVNEVAGQRGQKQIAPAIVMDNDGNLIVCWQDERKGNTDIYCQIFDSIGVARGTNFKVNSDNGNSGQSEPAIAVDSNGNFVICWTDNRDGNNDIYAQLYDYNGIAQTPNFKINDDAGQHEQSSPDIDIDYNGNFVICWTDDRNGNNDIYAQRFTNSGIAQGLNFKVNDDVGQESQKAPAIAVAKNGNFVICWVDDRNGNSDIYAQRFDNNGIAVGSNFQVNDDASGNRQDNPEIGSDSSGNFVICWEAYYRDNIYAQRYNSNGETQGTNFKVNSEGASFNPTIGVDINGNFIICWEVRGYYEVDHFDMIRARRYNSNGEALSFILGASSVNNNIYYSPDIAVNDSGKFAICWVDDIIDRADIFGQRYNKDGTSADSTFKVNDDFGGNDQINPSISVDDNGNFVICWEDKRDDEGDIYAQCYYNNGIAKGTNIKVNDDVVGESDEANSGLSMIDSTTFITCWQSSWIGFEGDLNYSIVAQRYNSNGSAIGTKLIVDRTYVYYNPINNPAISHDINGNFVICWEKENDDYNSCEIYAQRYNSDGIPQGSAIKVSESGDYYCHPTIDIGKSGNIIICWQNGRTEIFACQYNNDLTQQDTSFKVSDYTGTCKQLNPDIGIDSKGNFLICWEDNRNGNWDIYARRFYSNNTPQNSDFKVNSDAGSFNQGNPSIAFAGNNYFVICWHDDRNGDWDIYAQRFNDDGIPIGENYKVNNDIDGAGQKNPDVVCNNGRIYYTWQDNRLPEQQWDIYARVEDFSEITSHLSLTDTIATTRDTISIPITVDTYSSIGFAQFIIEYDSSTIKFVDAQIGTDISGFMVSSINPDLPFEPTTYGTNENVLVQISGGGQHSFSGLNKKVAILTFEVTANSGVSALAFDQGDDRTFLTTMNLNDLSGIYLSFVNGNITIATGVGDKTNLLIPAEFELFQNFPNPFNIETFIRFNIPKKIDANNVQLNIYSLQGQLIRKLIVTRIGAGNHQVIWDGADEDGQTVASGLYFYTLTAGKFKTTKKLLLIK